MTYQVHTTYEKGNEIYMYSVEYGTILEAEMHMDYAEDAAEIEDISTVQIIDSSGNRVATYQRH